MTAANANKNPARAVADLSEGTILAVVEIEAPPDRVFSALTDPKEVVAWWGSPDDYRVTEWKADLRVGGAWLSTGIGKDGATFSVGGEFVEIAPPHRLVQTWKAPWDGGNTTTIRYLLDPIPNGTRVTLRHTGFAGRAQSCEGHALGWERVLGWLTRHLVPEAPAEDAQYFVCKLLPPRPTFMQDMSAEETAIMQAHAGYWRALAAKGKAVVFGPVADPKGPHGLGILRVKGMKELEALRDADPTILAKRGFSYEVAPMIRAVLGASV